MIGSVSEAQAQMLAVEKGRRKRAQREREQAERMGRETAGEAPALTDAHAAAEAGMAAARDDRAAKAVTGDGVEPGPGGFRVPGPVEPEQFARPYIADGHASLSPMAQMPASAPLPTPQRGVPVPVQLPGVPVVTGSGPGVQGIAGHSVRAIITSPPMRGH